MFRWLTNLVTGHKKKETEINRLKAGIESGVDECKRKAAAGDQAAAKCLQEFEQTITEQSVRLLRGTARPAK